MPKPRKPRDENDERKKPCGFVGYCPLVDESRLFAEAQQILVEKGYSPDERRKITYIAIKKHCKRMAVLGLTPDIRVCRVSMERAAQAIGHGSDSERVSDFIRELYKIVREYEGEKRSLDFLDRAVQEVLGPAPF